MRIWHLASVVVVAVSVALVTALVGCGNRESVSRQKTNRPSVKFKFAHWNIGHFALGRADRTTVEPDVSASRAAEYRAKIAELGADFLGISEFEPEFDKAGRLATNVVFSSYPTMVIGPKDSYQCNAVFSRFPCVRNEIVDYDVRYQKAYFVDAVFRMGTNEVHVVQSHLDWVVRKDGYSYNKGQMRQLIEHFKNVPYVIIAADFNVNMVCEYSAFVEAGYTLANGGPAGTLNTARPHPKKPHITERILDNIIVKGFRVSDIFTGDNYFKLSDHRIFGCTLEML